MDIIYCGTIHDSNVEFPDMGGCCLGSAARGPQGCTCWRPVYDTDQADPILTAKAQPRKSPCEDCAFRSDSPENQGDPRYNPYSYTPTQPFYCHQGMRRIIAYRHPAGVEIPAAVEDRWDPPQDGDIVYKADGWPGDICAGWWQRAKRDPDALLTTLPIHISTNP